MAKFSVIIFFSSSSPSAQQNCQMTFKLLSKSASTFWTEASSQLKLSLICEHSKLLSSMKIFTQRGEILLRWAPASCSVCFPSLPLSSTALSGHTKAPCLHNFPGHCSVRPPTCCRPAHTPTQQRPSTRAALWSLIWGKIAWSHWCVGVCRGQKKIINKMWLACLTFSFPAAQGSSDSCGEQPKWHLPGGATKKTDPL